MKHYLFISLFLFALPFSWAQEPKRVLVNGQITVATNDLEGVNVYNNSTNKGTITNDKGEFTIEVGLNDELEVSALLFKKRIIIINNEVLESRSLKITLVETIYALEEVTVLPHQLSGDISEDISVSKVVEPFTFSYGDFNDYEFSADNKTKVEKVTINNGGIRYGLNVVAVFNEFIKPFLKTEASKKASNSKDSTPLSLSDRYTSTFLLKGFNIPEGEGVLFIEYVQNNGLPSDLLQDGNEMKLIAFLHEQSKRYLKVRDED